LTKTTAEFVSFKLPLKTDEFLADLYPPHPSNEASLTHD
jgi:hypothetical protein